MHVLVQVKTASEPSKFGLAPADLAGFLRTVSDHFPSLHVQGLMTLATHSPHSQEVRACFRTLRELRDHVRAERIPRLSLERLSMGMSDDFEIAIEEGSTELRIGTALFGARSYTPSAAPPAP
jgi:uncharacterized pyridoxal phosphate-containing UPF0001 family protein